MTFIDLDKPQMNKSSATKHHSIQTRTEMIDEFLKEKKSINQCFSLFLLVSIGIRNGNQCIEIKQQSVFFEQIKKLDIEVL